VVLVKSPDFRGECFFRAEGGGNKHQHGVKRPTTGDGEEFESVIEAGRVTSTGLNDRVEKREIGGI
jgi:hypothetical protein